MPREIEVADDVGPQQRHDVGALGEVEAGKDLLGDRRAAEHVAPLEHEHAPPGPREIGGVVRPLWPPPITMTSSRSRGDSMTKDAKGGDGPGRGGLAVREGCARCTVPRADRCSPTLRARGAACARYGAGDAGLREHARSSMTSAGRERDCDVGGASRCPSRELRIELRRVDARRTSAICEVGSRDPVEHAEGHEIDGIADMHVRVRARVGRRTRDTSCPASSIASCHRTSRPENSRI